VDRAGGQPARASADLGCRLGSKPSFRGGPALGAAPRLGLRQRLGGGVCGVGGPRERGLDPSPAGGLRRLLGGIGCVGGVAPQGRTAGFLVLGQIPAARVRAKTRGVRGSRLSREGRIDPRANRRSPFGATQGHVRGLSSGHGLGRRVYSVGSTIVSELTLAPTRVRTQTCTACPGRRERTQRRQGHDSCGGSERVGAGSLMSLSRPVARGPR
jgi:hypothetical protein